MDKKTFMPGKKVLKLKEVVLLRTTSFAYDDVNLTCSLFDQPDGS
jgi:hypothetical protein